MLRAEGATTKRGRPLTKSDVYRILSNRVYLGEAVHKGTAYPGEHEAIIDAALWGARRQVKMKGRLWNRTFLQNGPCA